MLSAVGRIVVLCLLRTEEFIDPCVSLVSPKSLSPGLAYMSKGFNAMVLIDKGCGGLGVTLLVF